MKISFRTSTVAALVFDHSCLKEISEIVWRFRLRALFSSTQGSGKETCFPLFFFSKRSERDSAFSLLVGCVAGDYISFKPRLLSDSTDRPPIGMLSIADFEIPGI